jgi:hypothetical protein
MAVDSYYHYPTQHLGNIFATRLRPAATARPIVQGEPTGGGAVAIGLTSIFLALSRYA